MRSSFSTSFVIHNFIFAQNKNKSNINQTKKHKLYIQITGILFSLVTTFPQLQQQQPVESFPSTTTTTTTQQPIEVTTRTVRYLNCFHNCPTTPEFNPYCGSDNNVYDNRQKIDCANICGRRHEQNWIGLGKYKKKKL